MTIPILLVAGVVVVALYFLLDQFAYQLRLRRHRGMPRESFIDHFIAQGIPGEIAAAVFDYYKRESFWRRFQAAPEDVLQTVFGRSRDDLEFDLERILRILQPDIPMPRTAVLYGYSGGFETVEDVVKLVDWILSRYRDVAHQPGDLRL